MPLEYTLLPKHAAILVRATGVVTVAEVVDHLTSLVADPDVPVPHVTLFDASEVVRLDLSEDDLVAITAFTVAHAPKSVARKLALVTRGEKGTERATQYERMAATFREQTTVFFHRRTACIWLGIPEES